MSGYAFEFHGATFTPDGKADIANAADHNAKVESAELAIWAQAPDRHAVYIVRHEAPSIGNGPRVFYAAETWLGTRLDVPGTLTRRAFRTNISRKMVAVRFKGTNGSIYHGRYGADWSQLCRARKAKA